MDDDPTSSCRLTTHLLVGSCCCSWQDLNEALKIISDVALSNNESIRRTQSMEKLAEIQARTTHSINHLTAGC